MVDSPDDERRLDRGSPAAGRAPTSSRFSRFAKLSGLTASVTARHLGQRMAAAFRDDDEQQKASQETQKKTAVQITRTLGELKGAAMKIGQMMATDPELLPPSMLEELATLQHSAPSMPLSTVKNVVQEALGRPIDDVFSDFSAAPIGAASIGQVHRAVLREDGRKVAVKVQYPGIADTIRSDMKNLGNLFALLRTQVPKERLDAWLEEFTSVLERESDYLREADNLERFHVVLKDLRGVRVPVPVHEHTRRNVLVMEFFDGEKLEPWLLQATEAEKTTQAVRLMEVFLQTMHRHHLLHADPHPGNFIVLTNEPAVDGAPPLGLLDAGCVREYDAAFTDELIRFLVALWRHDVDEMATVTARLGFAAGQDIEEVYEWNQLLLGPLLVDRDWDFGAWKIQEEAVRFLLAHPDLKAWAPPREMLFYVRTLAGLRGLLHKTGVKVNVYRLARSMAVERGLLRTARPGVSRKDDRP
jgi:predicted unusual protein kinase regulating ubiquinone biosynthesis (AarF/ABC1/UbiB family)